MAIDDRRIHLRPPSIVGSVIGTYSGPKAVGLASSRRPRYEPPPGETPLSRGFFGLSLSRTAPFCRLP